MTTHWHGRTIAPGPVGDCCAGHPAWHDLHETVWRVAWPGVPTRFEDYDTEQEATIRVAELRRTGRAAVAYRITTIGD